MIFQENHDFPRISLSGAWRLLEAPRSSRSHQRARSRPATLWYRLRIIHNAATNIPEHLEVSRNSLKALEHSQMRLQKNAKICNHLQKSCKNLQILLPKPVICIHQKNIKLYDWVHGGSTHFFMDPDKTKANLHRGESSYRREEARDDSKKLARAGGRLCDKHIQSRDHSS